jgi:hypothetical protein
MIIFDTKIVFEFYRQERKEGAKSAIVFGFADIAPSLRFLR